MEKKRETVLLFSIFLATVFTCTAHAQKQSDTSPALPVQYEEMTAPDFGTAVSRSASTCIIPIGILEKHGPHLPLGTDLLDVREIALRAARKEYTIVFPEYYFGQIFEARHQPGAIAYSVKLMWDVLQETCDELARNGIKKIILVNGHGGNNSFLPFFCQAQLASRRDYAVILFRPEDDPEIEKKVRSLRTTTTGGHADETETSTILVHHPGLVHSDRAGSQSGGDQNRLESLPYAYTGIWWYARYPNHYAGDGSHATREIGELLINSEVDQLVTLLRAIKGDDRILELQRLFFDGADSPLDTPQ